MANWVECNDERYLSAILAILNEQIRHGTALYELEEKTPADVRDWLAQKQVSQLPVIGLTSHHGDLLGFATLSRFRPQQATAGTYEHSLYVAANARGHGYGKQLLSAIVERAEQAGAHSLIGVIDANNAASIAMHKKAGFTEQGRLNQIAYKFDRWLDAIFMQKLFS